MVARLMWRYVAKRLALIVPTFVGITLACFALVQVLPGGPVEERLRAMRSMEAGEGGAGAAAQAPSAVTESYRQELRRHFGFDRPIGERYWKWLWTDRLGLSMPSYKYPNKTAWQLIRGRMPVSLWFGITGFVLSYLVCVPLGIAKTLRHGGRFDLASSVIVLVGYALPAFVVGMVLRMLLCGTSEPFWDILPLGGFQADNFAELTFGGKALDRVRHLALPIACYVMGNFAVLTLMMKNSLLDQISADYLRTVLSKGATTRYALWRHALRNALIPIATGFGGIMTVMFAGSVLIERVFEIPGMGILSLESLDGRDYAVFLGMLSITALLGLVGRIVSDISYLIIDPRIRMK
ncbi:MAG: ABC transporter permease subunit [Kiritimatiellaeota bacterium]|nr:ABC transporter permease subunit [Kiritimatiellota bacterium]